MTRNEFIKFLGAGIPETVKYYEINTPGIKIGRTDLVAIDEISIGGIARTSIRLICHFRSKEINLCLALNAFGGIYRWVASDNMKIVTRRKDFSWKIESPDLMPKEKPPMAGHILYIDQDGRRCSKLLTGRKGAL
jgi:hypothetical protein